MRFLCELTLSILYAVWFSFFLYLESIGWSELLHAIYSQVDDSYNSNDEPNDLKYSKKDINYMIITTY